MNRSHIYELAVIAFILLLFALLLYIEPACYGYGLMEDMPPEWFGFLMLSAGMWYWVKSAIDRFSSRSPLGAIFCVLMALLCLFVAGEEVSWGQRLFGFTPPEYFLQRNVQREVTIHNLALSWMQPRRIALLFMIVYGVLLPVIQSLLYPLRSFFQRRRIPIPTIGPAIGFGVSAWLMTLPVTGTDDEVGEVVFAFCLAAVALRASMPRNNLHQSLKHLTMGTAVISFIISALCFLNPEHRKQVINVGHLQAGLAYEGRGMMLDAAREYECLAVYWETHWELWIRVMSMYYTGHEMERAYRIGMHTLRANNRLWRVYELLAEIGRLTGREKEVSSLFRSVLIDEPYNIYALHGLEALNGKRWMYSAATKRSANFP